jgi:hypothetical protein
MRKVCLMMGFFIAAISACAQGVPGKAAEEIGHVTAVNGAWFDDACNCRVGQGYLVLRSSRIQHHGTPIDKDWVRIRIWSDANKEKTFSCPDDRCQKPLDVLSAVRTAAPSTTMTYLLAAFSVLKQSVSSSAAPSNSLTNYVTAMSRGLARKPLKDQIPVPNQDGSVNLSEFSPFKGGEPVIVDWCPIEPDGTASCSDGTTPITVPYQNGKLLLRNPALKPGFYQFQLTESGNKSGDSSQSVFLFLSHSVEEADKVRSQYSEFSSLIQSWPDSEKTMLLRAYLEHLSLMTNGPE